MRKKIDQYLSKLLFSKSSLYLSAFQKKNQIQNLIQFTFEKSQLKFGGFSIRAMTGQWPNAKTLKFKLRFCESNFFPNFGSDFFLLKGREKYRELYANWFKKKETDFFFYCNLYFCVVVCMIAAWNEKPKKPNMC